MEAEPVRAAAHGQAGVAERRGKDGEVRGGPQGPAGALQVLSSVQRVAAGNHEVLLRQPAEKSVRGSIGSADLTGLNLWPLSLPLLERLEHEILPNLRQLRSIDQPLRVLELGSGCGLLGIAVAALGEYVVLTDPAVDIQDSVSATTLDRLRENIELNDVADRAVAHKLLWGDDDDIAAISMLGPFDLILGCDLLYNTESHPALINTLRKLATHSNLNAPAYLAYPQRHPGEDEFFDLARLHFDVSVENIGDGWVTSGSGGLYGRLAQCRLPT